MTPRYSWRLISNNLVTKNGENRQINSKFWDHLAMKRWLFEIVWKHLVTNRRIGDCLANIIKYYISWNKWRMNVAIITWIFGKHFAKRSPIFAKSSPNCHHTFAKRSTVFPNYPQAVPHFQFWGTTWWTVARSWRIGYIWRTRRIVCHNFWCRGVCNAVGFFC